MISPPTWRIESGEATHTPTLQLEWYISFTHSVHTHQLNAAPLANISHSIFIFHSMFIVSQLCPIIVLVKPVPVQDGTYHTVRLLKAAMNIDRIFHVVSKSLEKIFAIDHF